MVTNQTYLKYIFALLLLLQGIVVIVHLYLAATNQINPWKLGGYAMYTIPAPNREVQFSEYIENIRDSTFKRLNWEFNYYCKHISASSLSALFQENPNLVGKNIEMVITTERFDRYPTTFKKSVISHVSITWQGDREFTYLGKACNQSMYDGQGTYIP